MKLFFGLVLLLAVFSPAAFAADAQVAECYLSIDGQTIMDGPCSYEPELGGDFYVKAGHWAVYGYVVDGGLDTQWNGQKGVDGSYYPISRAHSQLRLEQIGDNCFDAEGVLLCIEVK